MPKYKLSGDICHPGVLEFNGSEDELSNLLDDDMVNLADHEKEVLQIYDVDRSEKQAGFIPDGNITDEDDCDVILRYELGKLEDQLITASAAFDAAGGRGVEFAEEIDRLQADIAAHNVKAAKISKDANDPDALDFTVPKILGKAGFWLTVAKASIHIKDGDEGVSISVYALGSAQDESLGETWVTHGELEPDEQG